MSLRPTRLWNPRTLRPQRNRARRAAFLHPCRARCSPRRRHAPGPAPPWLALRSAQRSPHPPLRAITGLISLLRPNRKMQLLPFLKKSPRARVQDGQPAGLCASVPQAQGPLPSCAVETGRSARLPRLPARRLLAAPARTSSRQGVAQSLARPPAARCPAPRPGHPAGSLRAQPSRQRGATDTHVSNCSGEVRALAPRHWRAERREGAVRAAPQAASRAGPAASPKPLTFCKLTPNALGAAHAAARFNNCVRQPLPATERRQDDGLGTGVPVSNRSHPAGAPGDAAAGMTVQAPSSKRFKCQS